MRRHSDKITAVIDLKSGDAVHGVAGNRENYKKVRIAGIRDGSAIGLLDHYRSHGLHSLYIADLDSIVSNEPQFELLESMVRHAKHFKRIMIDLGDCDFSHDPRWASFIGSYESVCYIVATECMSGLESIRRILKSISSDRVILGLDYRQGNFVAPSEIAESIWLAESIPLGIDSIVVLDTSTVGTRSGPSIIGTIRRLRDQYPGLRIFSGGGIRDSHDVDELLNAGCESVLVATALHSHFFSIDSTQ